MRKDPSVHSAAEGPRERRNSLEECQVLESLPCLGGRAQADAGDSQDTHQTWAELEVVKSSTPGNTYIQFFKLPLNFTVHFNSVQVWIPDGKRLHEQQCSV